MEIERMELEQTVSALRGKGYAVSLFDTKEEAAQALRDRLHGQTIGFGDSQTLAQLGLGELLGADNQVFDPAVSHGGENFLTLARQALTADYFFTSANAMTADGVLVNLDGTGNRVAGSLFGHKQVFYVLGVNKIAPDLDAAVHRVRNTAAPQNARRLGLRTPCARTGRCHDCASPDRICNALLIQYRKLHDMEIEVVLIREALGY